MKKKVRRQKVNLSLGQWQRGQVREGLGETAATESNKILSDRRRRQGVGVLQRFMERPGPHLRDVADGLVVTPGRSRPAESFFTEQRVRTGEGSDLDIS